MCYKVYELHMVVLNKLAASGVTQLLATAAASASSSIQWLSVVSSVVRAIVHLQRELLT
jgi:hypothetical protein